MALQQYRVTGLLPVRDAVTKESVEKGGIVTLDDEAVPRPRTADGRKVPPLAGTNVAALLESGTIGLIEAEPKAKKG